MAPSHRAALPPALTHTNRCSYLTKRRAQDALFPTMGTPSTIPLLQMIITLLALSECLPISTGGTPPGGPRQYPHTNVLPSPLADKHARAVIQNMEKLWIQKFQNSDYFKQLPKSLQENVQEFLNSRTRTILQGDQSLNSQEHFSQENMPSSRSGNVNPLPDTSKSPETRKENHTSSNPNNNMDKTKSDNLTVLVVPEKSDHRSKRSYGRFRDLDNRIAPYLSDGPIDITYTHVVPCVYADRYYCLNGGTCVFVGALDLKTCRCPMGYTGLRCEMIDQEYILSLLTNSIMFD